MHVGSIETSSRVVLAPMAGGPGTVALAAAAGSAGAFPFLPFGYLSADQAEANVEELRAALPDTAFGVNLFVPSPAPADPGQVAAYAEEITGDARLLGAELGAPAWSDDGWEAKLALVERLRPAVASFTFGMPGAGAAQRLRRVGVAIWITVTSVGDALAAAPRADALVVQGGEAGGHQGSFHDDPSSSPLPLLELLLAVWAATTIPLVAAGGIGGGADAAEALAAGASTVQAGTAFLLADEAGTHPAQRAAMAEGRPTRLTRAFTGRLARGLDNGFIRDHEQRAIIAYPEVNLLTGPLRAEARRQGDAERFNLWAGERHASARAAPAAEIVADLEGRG